ncbi:hypothetical protein KKY25_004657 [Escherichia coli]|uniref:hypothetical protein n=1 Tax=Escherichia coli TaxID=562 RepID=UPI000FEDFBA6|nr:hypothetical protein [Escherichia coli]EHK8442542.1 hypothetical protein [Escherichia coli]EHL7982942.1 hypothetical protein [Escherichia coli]EHO1953449.1 hypothetical protein [Escherichia coli]EHO1997724.1 hypothetical protein [Escherichia coli]EHO3178266.1 hypothetical protein [Escherichia coli]
MSKDSSLENKDENITVKNTIEEAIRDKLFNKLFAYVVVSFFVVNWQDILILFKSKYDIYTTLSIVWVGDEYNIPFLSSFILPPFVAHFVMPFIYGTVASVIIPYVTLFISKATGRNYARIRYLDYEFDLKEKAKIEDLMFDLRSKESARLDLDAAIEERIKSLSAIDSKNKELLDDRVALFEGIKAIVDVYTEKNKRISSPEDFVDLLKAVERTDFYKDIGLSGINDLIADLKNTYEDILKPMSD